MKTLKFPFLLLILLVFSQSYSQDIGHFFIGINNLTGTRPSEPIDARGLKIGTIFPLIKTNPYIALKTTYAIHSAPFDRGGVYRYYHEEWGRDRGLYWAISNSLLLGFEMPLGPVCFSPWVGLGWYGDRLVNSAYYIREQGYFYDISFAVSKKYKNCKVGVILSFERDFTQELGYYLLTPNRTMAGVYFTR